MLSEIRCVPLPNVGRGLEAKYGPSAVRDHPVLVYGSRREGFICTYDPVGQRVTVEVAVIDGGLFGAEWSDLGRSDIPAKMRRGVRWNSR